MDLALVADPAVIELAGEVLARAFHDDPVVRWLLPDDPGTALMFTTLARYSHAITEAAYDAEGAMAGAALWDPPGHQPDEAGLPGFVEAMGERVSHGMVLEETFAAHRPAEPHWYLAQIGTLPEVRGRGVGGALLRTGLARCTGLPVYLECSKESNVSLYEKYGFHVTEEFRLPDGPLVWGMWRAAS
ncbi:GNAT family N-acetyltransferase [Nonomuraea sp. NPDC049028]|uniref:GNAT family N-acetyltransferase n=1 Tax=Nonomuraea sp. NPDC049028 TaxID=3364348 RepID=UPI003710FF61